MKVAFLVSGALGHKTILALSKHGVRPELLFTDRNSLDVISFANDSNIPLYVGKPSQSGAKQFLKDFQSIDLIFSINYLFLLDESILSFPKLGCVNIHGSLLPKYRGRTPHVWAIINNEKKTGITVHYIDKGCDTGDVIFQQEICIHDHFSGGDILKEFENRYPDIAIKTINLFANGSRPTGKRQEERLATYFGKRTENDGRIDWNWQRERIYNWVRAQAHPYPGAFTFYDEQKIVVDAIEFSATGFSWDMPNGLIITGGEYPEIKTPNGVVRLIKVRDKVTWNSGKFLK